MFFIGIFYEDELYKNEKMEWILFRGEKLWIY